MTPLNLLDYERLAAKRLPAAVFDYFASGANDEVTLRDNRAAFERRRLAYRVLVDVSSRTLETTVLGRKLALPVAVAPMAFQRLAHPAGEMATVRAAGRAGTLFVLSTLSTTPMEDVIREAAGPVWFQLYVYRDRAITRALVERAEAAGVAALALTVDAPLLGRRERDVRNRFELPAGISAANLLPAGHGRLSAPPTDSGLAAYFAELLDPSLSWRDVEWLRSITRLPVVLKGVVRADDAVRAIDHGAAAVIVSNHGGRQLDSAPAALDALEDIASAVGARAEVLMDGGVRRGTDVVKALALGARAVLLGRPVLWGLAADGEAGVGAVLALLRDEIDLALALSGCRSPDEVSRDLVV